SSSCQRLLVSYCASRQEHTGRLPVRATARFVAGSRSSFGFRETRSTTPTTATNATRATIMIQPPSIIFPLPTVSAILYRRSLTKNRSCQRGGFSNEPFRRRRWPRTYRACTSAGSWSWLDGRRRHNTPIADGDLRRPRAQPRQQLARFQRWSDADRRGGLISP